MSLISKDNKCMSFYPPTTVENNAKTCFEHALALFSIFFVYLYCPLRGAVLLKEVDCPLKHCPLSESRLSS